MVRKRKSLVQITCEAKVAWPSRRLAKRALSSQECNQDFNSRDRKPLEVYKCKFCAQWHVGSGDAQRSKVSRVERNALRDLRKSPTDDEWEEM